MMAQGAAAQTGRCVRVAAVAAQIASLPCRRLAAGGGWMTDAA